MTPNHFEKVKKATKGDSVIDLIWAALRTDGEHHKQWYLEAIGLKVGMELDLVGHKRGIAS